MEDSDHTVVSKGMTKMKLKNYTVDIRATLSLIAFVMRAYLGRLTTYVYLPTLVLQSSFSTTYYLLYHLRSDMLYKVKLRG